MDDLQKVPQSPKTSPLPKNNNLKTLEVKIIDFGDAMDEVLAGKKITKLEWKNKDYYAFLRKKILTLHEPNGKYHEWIVSEGDLAGNDYIVV